MRWISVLGFAQSRKNLERAFFFNTKISQKRNVASCVKYTNYLIYSWLVSIYCMLYTVVWFDWLRQFVVPLTTVLLAKMKLEITDMRMLQEYTQYVEFPVKCNPIMWERLFTIFLHRCGIFVVENGEHRCQCASVWSHCKWSSVDGRALPL